MWSLRETDENQPASSDPYFKTQDEEGRDNSWILNSGPDNIPGHSPAKGCNSQFKQQKESQVQKGRTTGTPRPEKHRSNLEARTRIEPSRLYEEVNRAIQHTLSPTPEFVGLWRRFRKLGAAPSPTENLPHDISCRADTPLYPKVLLMSLPRQIIIDIAPPTSNFLPKII